MSRTDLVCFIDNEHLPGVEVSPHKEPGDDLEQGACAAGINERVRQVNDRQPARLEERTSAAFGWIDERREEGQTLLEPHFLAGIHVSLCFVDLGQESVVREVLPELAQDRLRSAIRRRRRARGDSELTKTDCM